MYLRLTLIGMWLSALMLIASPSFAGSYEAQAPQDAKAKLERMMLKQQHGPSLQERLVEKSKTRWQEFRQKQKARPLIDRMLRLCLLCVIGALVLGLLAGPLSNISVALGAVLSIVGSAAALGALIFFILWIMEQV